MPDAPRTTHPTAEQLANYRAGKLPADERAEIARHVNTCSACSKQLEQPGAEWFVGQSPTPTPRGSTLLPGSPPPASAPDLRENAEEAVVDLPPALASSGKFQVLSKLGEGGMGVVYKARRRLLGDVVAIKVMNAAVASHPEALDRFLREIKTIGQLREHPQFVQAYDADKIGDLIVLVMEFIDGRSLDRLVRKKGPMPIPFACQCIAQAAEGLQHAHDKAIAHRDIKPANLMVTRDRQIKIFDLGLAQVPREQKSAADQTRMGTCMGTPAYMPPEQATSAGAADHRADIYSLGCTLYFLLAGRPPFQADTDINTILAHLQQEPQPLTELRADVPAGLWAVIAKMMAKSPAQRYQSAREVSRALQPFTSTRKGEGEESGERPSLVRPSASRTALTASGETRRPRPSRSSSSAAGEQTRSGVRRRGKPPTSGSKRWLPLAIGGGAALLALIAGILVLALNGSHEDPKAPPAKLARAEKKGPRKSASTGETSGQLAAAEKPAPTNPPGATLEKKTAETSSASVPAAPPPPPPPVEDRTEVDKPAEKPIETSVLPEGFQALFNGKDTTGWRATPGTANAWKVDENGCLVGSGAASFLFTERGDYKNFHFLVEVMINDQGASGQLFRADFAGADPGGYKAQINSTSKDPAKTGSLFIGAQRAEVRNAGIAPGRWFQQEVIALDNHLLIRVDGKVLVNRKITDKKRFFAQGSLALQVLDAGTVVKFRKVAVRELPALVPSFAATSSAAVETPWQLEGDEWLGGGGKWEHRLNFGDPQWSDYDFTVEAKMLSGNAGFGMRFRAASARDFDSVVVGGNVNTCVQVVSNVGGRPVNPPPSYRHFNTIPFLAGGLQQGRWYQARVSVRGNAGSCFVDGRKIFDFRADRHARGAVGLQLWGARYRFRNLRVTDPEGKVLLEGLPDLDPRVPTEEVSDSGKLAVFNNPPTAGLFYALNGSKLIAVESGASAEVCVCDMAKHMRIPLVRLPSSAVNSVAVSRTGGSLAVLFNRTFVRAGRPPQTVTQTEYQVFRLTSRLEKIGGLTLKSPTWAVNLRFASGAKHLMVLYTILDTLHVVEARTAKEVRPALKAKDVPERPFVGYVPITAFSSDNKQIASGEPEGLIRIWDADTGKDVQQFPGDRTETISALKFHPDGKRLISGTHSGNVFLWGLAGGPQGQRLAGGHQRGIRCLVVTPDGKRLLSGGFDGGICMWDLETGKLTHRLVGHDGTVACLAVSPDGRTLASSGWDKTVRVWRLPR